VSAIERRHRTVYFAPTANRSFLTARAAASREAAAMLAVKYPSEREERDAIGITNRSWHWSHDERLCKVHARLTRRIATAIRSLQENKNG